MPRGESSAAYDFELFENKEPRAHPTLSLVGNQKYEKRDRMASVRIVSCVALVVAIVCVMLYGRAQLTELSHKIGQFNDEYQQLQSEYTRISAEMEGKVSLRGVEERAQEMGLSKVQSYQVEYVNIDAGESFEESASVPSKPSIMDKLSLYIGSFFENMGFQ